MGKVELGHISKLFKFTVHKGVIIAFEFQGIFQNFSSLQFIIIDGIN